MNQISEKERREGEAGEERDVESGQHAVPQVWQDGPLGKELLAAPGLLPMRPVALRPRLSIGPPASLLQMRAHNPHGARLPHGRQLLQVSEDGPFRQGLHRRQPQKSTYAAIPFHLSSSLTLFLPRFILISIYRHHCFLIHYFYFFIVFY